MTQILHIIGTHGVGKSTLALQIKDSHNARGRVCENLLDLGLHEAGFSIDVHQYRDFKYRPPYTKELKHVDVLIIEHLQDPEPHQLRPGDLIIRMERVSE
jgi:molybdopterin-guanine dinucleotide biosynthesis protein